MALLNSTFMSLCTFIPQDGYGLKGYLRQSSDKKSVSMSLYWIYEGLAEYKFDGVITVTANGQTVWSYSSDGVGGYAYMYLKSNGSSERAVGYYQGTPSGSFSLPENCSSITVTITPLHSNYGCVMAYTSTSSYKVMQTISQTFAVEPYFNDAVQLYDGSAWNKYKAQIYNGSWADYKPQVYDGSAWKDVG